MSGGIFLLPFSSLNQTSIIQGSLTPGCMSNTFLSFLITHFFQVGIFFVGSRGGINEQTQLSHPGPVKL